MSKGLLYRVCTPAQFGSRLGINLDPINVEGHLVELVSTCSVTEEL